jgi:hypothetical protein
VALVDLCSGGALIEGRRPFRPGARVHLQLTTPDRTWSLAAHVLRCSVWSIDAIHGILYRGAVRFEERCEWLREAGTLGGYPLPGTDDLVLAPAGQSIPGGEGTRQP